MEPGSRRAELSAFLRVRRQSLRPETVGLPRFGRRLVKGLRREELASLARIGVTWYTWLEQGRDIRVSADTGGRIARAMQLSPSDTEYLFRLLGVPQPEPATEAAPLREPLEATIDAFLGPALLVAPTLEVRYANAFAEALYEFDAFEGRFARNILWRALIDPRRREFYVDFDSAAPKMIGLLRVHYARHVGDPEFEALVAELLAKSPEFTRVWNDRETASPAPLLLRIQSPTFGPLSFHSVRLTISDVPDHIVALLPPADAVTSEVVTRWCARS